MSNTHIKEIRKKLYLTQKQVAESVGISHRQYQCIEAGTSRTSVQKGIAIADLFKRDIHEVFPIQLEDYIKKEALN